MILRAFAIAAAALSADIAVRAQDDAARDPQQFALPAGLTEISGLAAASVDTVFAHNDEHAIVYEIDLSNGEVVSAFALGDPTARGDFEGIAATEERVYLITSNGRLYEADIGEHRKRVRFNVFDTGVGEACEIEGLSLAPAPGEFLILCKRALNEARDDRLMIYRWSLDDRTALTAPWVSLRMASFVPQAERSAFRPAGIEWDEANRVIWVLSARSHRLYLFDEKGAFLRKTTLPADRHVQAEGVAVTPSGALIVADEAAGRGAGVVSVYETPPE